MRFLLGHTTRLAGRPRPACPALNVIVKKGKEGGSIEYLPRSGKSEPPATDYPPITRADCVLNSIVVVKKPQAEPNGARRSPRSPGRTLGYIDLEQRTLQTIDNPFGTRLSPMSQVRSVTHVSGLYKSELVPRDGLTSNREVSAEELFETLAEWGEYLNKEGIDVKQAAERRKHRSRGPSPC